MKTRILSIIAIAALSVSILSAETAPQKAGKHVELQAATGVFDIQQNTLSPVDFRCMNTGIFGFNTQITNMAEKNYGLVWPRGSNNQYIFGAGFWFGAKKQVTEGAELSKLACISYNPNSGRSYFVPGSISEGNELSEDKVEKNRIYVSTDFDQTTGEVLNPTDGPNWPLWLNSDGNKYQFGTNGYDYVIADNLRNTTAYPKGPLFVSDEDMVSIMKDTDLNYYDKGPETAAKLGYPLGLEVQQKIYSWESGELANTVVISYLLYNKSTDTLYDCYLGHMEDIDILDISDGSSAGARNDRSRYYNEDPSLNLGYAWTETDKGELGAGLGYIGIALLETPAVDAQNFIRNDKLIFEPSEQVGLSAFPNWSIASDKLEDEDRYDLMASGEFAKTNEPTDIRMMLSAGTFNMRPGEFCHLAIAITFADPAKGGEADGTPEDITGLTDNGKVGKLLSSKNSLIGLNEKVREEYYKALSVLRVNDYMFNAEELSVYPNPASEIISLPISLSTMKNYAIYNLTGTLTAEGMTSKDINIADLQTGAYVLLIDGKVYKFIKK